MKIITNTKKYLGIQGIYGIVNITKQHPNCCFGMPYIGQACVSCKNDVSRHRGGIGTRVVAHKQKLRKNVHENIKLQNAWNKYGENSFLFLEIEIVNDYNLLTEREQFWTDEWDSFKLGYNLRPVVDSNLGIKTKLILEKSVLIDWIKDYYNQNGKFPHHSSGVIGDITWNAVDKSLRDGFRGFDGNSSLSEFIASNFGIATLATSNDYSEKIICEWIERFYEENGSYPKKRSGDIPYASEYGISDTTWVNVDHALRHGFKGLPSGSSLYKFILKNGKYKKGG